MKLTRNIINEHIEVFENFQYYHTILDLIESNINTNPDISIESCKSLFEGISKSILSKLDNLYSSSEIEDKTVQQLVKRMFKKLKEFIEIEELNYISVFVSEIGTIRNKRGDISHGRPAPKEISSDIYFAKMVVNSTDNYVFYILRLFFSINFEEIKEYKYDDYEEFNEWLDQQDTAGFFSSYSLALFETDYIRYEQELQNFYPDLDF
jgi:hypothetical protein